MGGRDIAGEDQEEQGRPGGVASVRHSPGMAGQGRGGGSRARLGCKPMCQFAYRKGCVCAPN